MSSPPGWKNRKSREIIPSERSEESLVSNLASSMDQNEDILSEIAAILGDTDTAPEPYDPERPGMGETHPEPPTAGAEKLTAQDYRPQCTRKTVPAVGCMVSRSDRQNRAKLAALMAPPPPPPPKRRPPPPRSRPTLEPARVMGPITPPPVSVELEPGLVADIPHFSVHNSREYKMRYAGFRWHLRFNANGSVRSVKKRR